MLEFIGHFHPLILHLPIGILVLGVLLFFWFKRNPEVHNDKVLKFTFQMAFYSGVIACMTGYLLKDTGSYGEELVDRHQWSAIALTVLTGIYAFINISERFQIPYLIGTTLLLSFTGHQGGSLTHGEDFLSFKSKKERAPITNVNEAVIYTDIIQPILEDKCYQCHSSRKQKGDLRLDNREAILAGGEGGKVLLAHNVSESTIFQRLILPQSNEEHMPPKGKPQPTEDEVKLIEWWVANGGGFEQKVKEVEDKSSVQKALTKLENPEEKEQLAVPLIPSQPIAAAPKSVLNQLTEMRVSVVPLSEKSNYLSVNFLGKPKLDCSSLEALKGAEKHIVWLKLNDTNIDDTCMEVLAKMPNLLSLDLSGTNITDKGMERLVTLTQLQRLYIVNTQISQKSLTFLQKMTKLKKLYIYQTEINISDYKGLQGLLPKVQIDTGGYQLPVLATDTTLLSRAN